MTNKSRLNKRGKKFRLKLIPLLILCLSFVFIVCIVGSNIEKVYMNRNTATSKVEENNSNLQDNTSNIKLGNEEPKHDIDEENSNESKDNEDIEFNKYQKHVSITFDDGPSSKNTIRLLDVLKKHNVKSTFFLVGQSIPGNEEIVSRTFKEGHAIGNHSFSHPDLTTISENEVASELNRTDSLVNNIIGENPKYIRAPYGANDDAVLRIANRPNILWSIDSTDWKLRDADQIYDKVTAEIEDGSIILLHDIHSESVDMVDRLIDYLHEEGYGIITVEKLLNKPREARNYYQR